MSLEKIYSLYQTMEQEKVILSFNGVVTSDFLTAVLDIMENKMNDLDESPKTKKKVYYVLVECLQNLYHHIEDEEGVITNSKVSKVIYSLLIVLVILVIRETGSNYDGVVYAILFANMLVPMFRAKSNIYNGLKKKIIILVIFIL
mgnify:CR=1 FL=1